MALPATSGILRTSLNDMKKGDYFAFKYVAPTGAIGNFPEMFVTAATAQANEISATESADTPNGYAYAICAGPGLFVSDRVVQRNISWTNVNAGKCMQGKYGYHRNANISFDLVETVTGMTADSYLKNVGLRNARTICLKLKEHAGGYSWNGIGNLKLLLNGMDINVKKMKAQLHPAPYLVYSDSEYGGNYPSWQALDGDETTGWLSAMNEPVNLFYDMGLIKQFDSYSIRTPVASDGGTHAKGWDLMISTQAFGYPYIVRSLTGGIIYQDSTGKPSTTAAWLNLIQLDYQQGSFNPTNPYTKIFNTPLETDTIGFRIGSITDQTVTEVEIYDENNVNIAAQASVTRIQSPTLSSAAGLTDGNKTTYVWDNAADMDGVLFAFSSKKRISKVCIYGHSSYPLLNVYLVRLPDASANTGCFPSINEFDSILRNSDLDGAITPNDANVWHHTSMRSWCQEAPHSSIVADSSYRVARNEKSASLSATATGSSSTTIDIGFRPVFQFLPPNAKATSVWF